MRGDTARDCWRSIDRGERWTRVPFPVECEAVTAIAIDPSDKDHLVIGSRRLRRVRINRSRGAVEVRRAPWRDRQTDRVLSMTLHRLFAAVVLIAVAGTAAAQESTVYVSVVATKLFVVGAPNPQTGLFYQHPSADTVWEKYSEEERPRVRLRARPGGVGAHPVSRGGEWGAPLHRRREELGGSPRPGR